ncbi:hypothetical protein OG372_34475 [Streptomyces sp. NBC_01020]|uniref:hypothetical protein n=1 Tax=Streptomyces sp. NBC_01020 TaxID=2903722 RepID=UPI00386DEC7A|nr:hypothetical protein OG372_34475 [Streptomyces sp. NBC_01020]
MKRLTRTATAVAAGLLLLGTLGTATATAETGTSGTATAPGGVLGPDGYKGIQLGQSERDAEKTGLLVNKQTTPGCDFYRLAASEGKPNLGGGVFIEPRKGVVVITGTNLIRTPEGITMGTGLARVKAAYPRLTKVGDFIFETPVPGGTPGERYRFAVDEQNLVADFALEATDRGTCDS